MTTGSILGIDLGGTKIAAVRYGAAWETQAQERVFTHADQQVEGLMQELLRVIERNRGDDTSAIGIGVPGLVSRDNGVVLTMPNIPCATNIGLREELTKRTGLPVIVENDAHCFALAEALHGIGTGHSVVVGIAMGTGVGGGIIVDGKIFHGSSGFSGEIGHMLLQPGHPPSADGNHRGEVEQFFSGRALARRCTQAEKPEQLLNGETCAFLYPDIAKEVAWMCVNLTHLLDPSIIVFGGSVGRALVPRLPEIQKALTEWLLPGTPLPRLSIGTLTDAGTRGAALLAAECGLKK